MKDPVINIVDTTEKSSIWQDLKDKATSAVKGATGEAASGVLKKEKAEPGAAKLFVRRTLDKFIAGKNKTSLWFQKYWSKLSKKQKEEVEARVSNKFSLMPQSAWVKAKVLTMCVSVMFILGCFGSGDANTGKDKANDPGSKDNKTAEEIPGSVSTAKISDEPINSSNIPNGNIPTGFASTVPAYFEENNASNWGERKVDDSSGDDPLGKFFKSEINISKKKIAKASKELKTLNTKEANLQSAIKNIEEGKSDLTKDLSKYQKDLVKLQGQKLSIQKQLEDQQSKIQELKEKVKGNKEALAELEKQRKQCNIIIKQLEAQLIQAHRQEDRQKLSEINGLIGDIYDLLESGESEKADKKLSQLAQIVETIKLNESKKQAIQDLKDYKEDLDEVMNKEQKVKYSIILSSVESNSNNNLLGLAE